MREEIESAIIEFILNAYRCRNVKSVGICDRTIKVKRRERIGVEKKILGIFPKYKYDEWYETLDKWNYITLTLASRWRGKNKFKVRIAVCYDKEGDTVYWRYA